MPHVRTIYLCVSSKNSTCLRYIVKKYKYTEWESNPIALALMKVSSLLHQNGQIYFIYICIFATKYNDRFRYNSRAIKPNPFRPIPRRFDRDTTVNTTAVPDPEFTYKVMELVIKWIRDSNI